MTAQMWLLMDASWGERKRNASSRDAHYVNTYVGWSSHRTSVSMYTRMFFCLERKSERRVCAQSSSASLCSFTIWENTTTTTPDLSVHISTHQKCSHLIERAKPSTQGKYQGPETRPDVWMRTTEDKFVRFEAWLALLLNICAKLT